MRSCIHRGVHNTSPGPVRLVFYISVTRNGAFVPVESVVADFEVDKIAGGGDSTDTKAVTA